MTNNFLSVFDEYLLVVPDSITADQLLHYMVLEDCENQKKRILCCHAADYEQLF